MTTLPLDRVSSLRIHRNSVKVATPRHDERVIAAEEVGDAGYRVLFMRSLLGGNQEIRLVTLALDPGSSQWTVASENTFPAPRTTSTKETGMVSTTIPMFHFVEKSNLGI